MDTTDNIPTPDVEGQRGLPQSVRFPKEESMIRELMQTGLSFADVLRLSVRYAAPKFLSGEVNPLTFERVATQPAPTEGGK